MKVSYSSEKINPFGGICFVDKILANTGIYKLIDNELGSRASQAKYSYSDIIRSQWLITLCGGDCAEDITEHLRPHLENIKSYSHRL